ncbi:MAG: hypothetical protein AAGF13_06660 [Pseudomonadota bacterium]
MPGLFSQKFHAFIDYPVAGGLLALPLLLGLGTSSPLALYLSIVTGAAAFMLTALTDHETGMIKILPYRFHLAVDFLVGVTFVAAPFVLGFSGLDMAYYLVMGATVIVVVGLHKPSDEAVI